MNKQETQVALDKAKRQLSLAKEQDEKDFATKKVARLQAELDAFEKKAEPKKAEPKKAEPKKAEPKKAEPKKAEPKKEEPKGKDEYDCDELIAKVKERRAKAKANAKKNKAQGEGTKTKKKIDKVHSAIEKQVESGKLAKNELQRLIKETKELLAVLEKAYKSAK